MEIQLKRLFHVVNSKEIKNLDDRYTEQDISILKIEIFKFVVDSQPLEMIF